MDSETHSSLEISSDSDTLIYPTAPKCDVITPTNKLTRKRDVDTKEYERIQLFLYSQEHPKATQQEKLSQWFSTTFNNQINQSTVSRMSSLMIDIISGVICRTSLYIY